MVGLWNLMHDFFIIHLRWNVKRDVRASIGAYGGGNGAYERVFTEKMRRK